MKNEYQFKHIQTITGSYLRQSKFLTLKSVVDNKMEPNEHKSSVNKLIFPQMEDF